MYSIFFVLFSVSMSKMIYKLLFVSFMFYTAFKLFGNRSRKREAAQQQGYI